MTCSKYAFRNLDAPLRRFVGFNIAHIFENARMKNRPVLVDDDCMGWLTLEKLPRTGKYGLDERKYEVILAVGPHPDRVLDFIHNYSEEHGPQLWIVDDEGKDWVSLWACKRIWR